MARKELTRMTTVAEPVKTITGVPMPVKTPAFAPVRAPEKERELVPVKREKQQEAYRG